MVGENSRSAMDWRSGRESGETCCQISYKLRHYLNIFQREERGFSDSFELIIVEEERVEVSQTVESLVVYEAEPVV